MFECIKKLKSEILTLLPLSYREGNTTFQIDFQCCLLSNSNISIINSHSTPSCFRLQSWLCLQLKFHLHELFLLVHLLCCSVTARCFEYLSLIVRNRLLSVCTRLHFADVDFFQSCLCCRCPALMAESLGTFLTSVLWWGVGLTALCRHLLPQLLSSLLLNQPGN